LSTKTCRICNEEKPLADFPYRKDSSNFRSEASTNTYCRACSTKKTVQWRKEHPGYKGTGKLLKVPPEERLLMSAIRVRLSEAKSRAKKLNQPEVSVDEDRLLALFKEQNGCCALSGVKMLIEMKHPLSLSLDKIEPAQGYTVGNVQWTAWAVNRAKGDLSHQDFLSMCECVLAYQKVQRLSKGEPQ
jgi:hypothetical protein